MLSYVVVSVLCAALGVLYWAGINTVYSRLLIPKSPATSPPKTETATTKTEEKPPTLLDLYKSSFPNTLRVDGNSWGLLKDNSQVLSGPTKIYLDFDAKTKFVSFYIPTSKYSYEAASALWSQVNTTFAAVAKSVGVQAGYGHNPTDLKDLTFSGRVFLWHEDNFNLRQLADLVDTYKTHGMALDFRGPDYLANQVVAWHHQHDAKVAESTPSSSPQGRPIPGIGVMASAESGIVKSVVLSLGVDIFPRGQSHKIPYVNRSLQNLHITLVRAAFLWPLDPNRPTWRGWDSCLVADKRYTELNNDSADRILGTIEFDARTRAIVLSFYATASTGEWQGTITFKNADGHLDIDEWIMSTSDTASGISTVLIHNHGFQQEIIDGSHASNEWGRVKREQWQHMFELGSLPVHRPSHEEIQSTCREPKAFATEVF